MGADHGGAVTLKPIGEIAEYLKNLIPANIHETYALKPMFENVACEGNIRSGVVAFRDFLYLFCDRLISDGYLYVKPQKNPKSATDYPFLYNITDLLADIGYHGKLSESGDSLLLDKLPSVTASTDGNGNVKKPKNSVSRLMECLRFLALCGFVFTGVDPEEKTLNISETQLLEVSYPSAPALMTGLKALSIADVELRAKRYKTDDNHDNLLWCDYRLLKAEDTDVLDVLKDFLHPLPESLQELALELHRRYIDMGMTCVTIISTFDIHFAYSYVKKGRRVLSSRDIYTLRIWELALSVRYGYSLVIRAKNTDKYADVIKKFPLSLQEKIARGYGCDRKLRNERCQGGCQGFRIPLDDSMLNIGPDIKIWLDNEASCSIKNNTLYFSEKKEYQKENNVSAAL